MINFADILGKLEGQQQAANKANLERYEELLRHIAALGEQTHGSFQAAREKIGTLGGAARTRIGREGVAQRGQIEQDLISRGLGNTTIRTSALAGQREREALTGIALDESLAGQQAGVDLAEAGNQFNVGSLMARAIEGRTDAGPNLSLYGNLLSQAAANQGPAGGKIKTFIPPSSGGPSLAESLRAKLGSSLPSGAAAGGGVKPGVSVVTNPNATSQPSIPFQASTGAEGGGAMGDTPGGGTGAAGEPSWVKIARKNIKLWGAAGTNQAAIASTERRLQQSGY